MTDRNVYYVPDEERRGAPVNRVRDEPPCLEERKPSREEEHRRIEGPVYPNRDGSYLLG